MLYTYIKTSQTNLIEGKNACIEITCFGNTRHCISTRNSYFLKTNIIRKIQATASEQGSFCLQQSNSYGRHDAIFMSSVMEG